VRRWIPASPSPTQLLFFVIEDSPVTAFGRIDSFELAGILQTLDLSFDVLEAMPMSKVIMHVPSSAAREFLSPVSQCLQIITQFRFFRQEGRSFG